MKRHSHARMQEMPQTILSMVCIRFARISLAHQPVTTGTEEPSTLSILSNFIESLGFRPIEDLKAQ